MSSIESNSNEESSLSRHGCAACKHQRRKCGEDCLLQPYFRLNRTQDFQAAQKIFGISNMNKMMKELQIQDRPRAIESLVWEASIWKQDPVNGPLGLYKQLEQENELLKYQLNQLKGVINGVGIVPNYDPAINFGDVNTVDFCLGRRNFPILAPNYLPLGQDSFSCLRPINGVVNNEEEEILNQRGNFHGLGPGFGYVAAPVNRVRGRDICHPNYFHNQLGLPNQENNLNWPHLPQIPNPTQQLPAFYSNCIEGQSSYTNAEIMEDEGSKAALD